jgi:Flp pilus assembly protein TadG
MTPYQKALARRRAAHTKQRGSAAIEFAMLFGIMFVVAYGAISYALIMLLQQSLVQAASEGARAAAGKLSYIQFSSTAQLDSELTKLARAAATSSLAWLPQDIQTHITGDGITVTRTAKNVPVNTGSGGTKSINMDTITVQVKYAGYASKPLLPLLVFPGVGSDAVPGLPADLVGTATVTP